MFAMFIVFVLSFVSPAYASGGCSFTSYLPVAEKSGLHIGLGQKTGLVVSAQENGAGCVELGDLRKKKAELGEEVALMVTLPDGRRVARSDLIYTDAVITDLDLEEGGRLIVQLIRPWASSSLSTSTATLEERLRECKSTGSVDEQDQNLPPPAFECGLKGSQEKWTVEETYVIEIKASDFVKNRK